MNNQISRVALFSLVLLAALVVATTYWQTWASGGLAARQDNEIQRVAQFEIKRGLIYAADGHTVLAGNVRRLTDRAQDESQPNFSPDGTRIAYWHSRGGERGSANAIWLAPVAGGVGTEITKQLDRNVYRAVWMPDGKSFLTGGHDATTTAYWLVDADSGAVRRLDLGEVEPAHGYWPDANVARNGLIAFTGTTPNHPRELWVMTSVEAKPRQLTHFNDWASSKDLGRAERITWRSEGMDEDGVVITPPGVLWSCHQRPSPAVAKKSRLNLNP